MNQIKVLLLCVYGLTCTGLHGQISTSIPDSNIMAIIDILPKKLTFTATLDSSKIVQERGALDTAVAYTNIGLKIALEQKDDDLIKEAFTLLMRQHDLQGKHLQTKATADFLLDVVNAKIPTIKIKYGSIYAALRLQQFEEANEMLISLEPYLSDIDPETLGEYYSYKAIYEYTYTRNLVQALDYFLVSKDYSKDKPLVVSRINNNLAGIYHTLQDIENCVALLDENIAIAKEQNDPLTEIMTYYNRGIILNEAKDYQGLLSTGQHAIDLSKHTGVTHSISLAYTAVGQGYLGLDQLDSALVYFNMAIEKAKQEGSLTLSMGAHAGLMELYLHQNDTEKARYHGDMAYEYGGLFNFDIAPSLASIYAKLGQVDKAYTIMQDGYEDVRLKNEDLSNSELIKKLVEARQKQALQHKEQEYQTQLEQQQDHNRHLLFGVLAFSLSIIIFLLLYSRRQLQKSNQSLMESNEALRQFAYITSHDLKEPIRNITSFSGLLNRSFTNAQANQEQREYLQFITNSAGVLKEIVESLKVFIKASFGELERETVHVDEVFAVVREHSQALLAERNGQLCFSTTDDISTLTYSKAMLILVLQNLIHNGLTYNTNEQPTVKVKINKLPNSSRFQFSVQDNGVGIAPKYQQVIFSPFKTLQNKSVTQSSGLGLSICKTIVERYGGTISVSSDGSNGAEFRFTV